MSLKNIAILVRREKKLAAGQIKQPDIKLSRRIQPYSQHVQGS